MTDHKVNMRPNTVSISQGEYAIASQQGSVISTILGSCVATCLWDETAGVGGMNHILVAQRSVAGVACDFEGVNAMELLINAIVREGGDRSRLQAKVFGGARMVKGLSDIGHANGNFALKFLEQEKIPCLGHSLGGSSARHIRFFPAEGRVMQKTVSSAPELKPVTPVPDRNDVELF
jgi:chemotaxis protein CheD